MVTPNVTVMEIHYDVDSYVAVSYGILNGICVELGEAL